MQLTGSNITIMVKDMNRSVSFDEMTGLKLKQRCGDNYAMTEGPGIMTGIHPGGDESSVSGDLSTGFMVDDFEESKALLHKKIILP